MGSPCECRNSTPAIIRAGLAAPAPGAGYHSSDGYQSQRDGRWTITARPLHLRSCHPRTAADEQDGTPARCRLWPRHLLTVLAAAGYSDLTGCDGLEHPDSLPAGARFTRHDLEQGLGVEADGFDVVTSIAR